ncbi:MAG: TonB-dependent receptor [Bacteroidota bacterium]
MKKILRIKLKPLLLLAICVTPALSVAQTVVTGTVLSGDDGQPLPGVNILIKGSTTGTTTDIDGNYSISVQDDNSILVFSFVGYSSQEITVSSRNRIDLSLNPDISQLEEIVVIGYGTQQTRDLTSAISTIKTEEITTTPNSNPMQALQGKVAGVQITSNGSPGASPNVRVRGLGSITGNNDPLYVVDGMFVDNIDFLNSTDIANISVLKDASASAIYGVRGANGVVLIETNSGQYNQPTKIVYDGYYGVQVPQNVLQMSNSEQFANYVRQTGNDPEIELIENAIGRYGRSRVNPNLPVTNTDWYNEVMTDAAPIQNHSLTISGGNDRARYSVGGSYFNQEGLIDHMRNDYERLNFRGKIDAIANDWLTVGANITLSNATQFNADNAVWFQTYFAIPTLPVFDELNTDASPTAFGNAQQIGYRGRQNPFFVMENNDNRNRVGKILGNFYADFEILPEKLSFKTSYNYFYNNIQVRNVDLAYNDGEREFQNGLTRISETSYNQIWDNVLTYQNNFGDHNLTLTGGYSYRSEVFEENQSRAEDIRTLTRNEEDWYIPDNSEVNTSETFSDGDELFGISFFGRAAYNYKDKYLLYGTYRRDGTNRFAGFAKWGDFYTIGAGWVLTEENFFNVPGIDFFKLRAGYGEIGNEGINPAIGQTTFNQIGLAIGDELVTGVRPDNVFDLVTTWETTAETNVGVSARFLNQRLSLEADWFQRDTEDAVVNVFQPGAGEFVRRNAGSVRNSGLELALNWSDNVGDISYNIGANFATLDNEVLSVGNQVALDAGSAEFRQRSAEGSGIREFFGYEIIGVFQTQEDVTNSGYTTDFISTNNLEPGDFHFRDQNGDGIINADDRVFLGSFLPSYTFGFNFGITYRNLSLTAFLQGQGGNKILNRKRGEIIFTQDTNIDADLANNFWDGAGSTNEYPSASGYRKPYNNNQLSEFLLEDGDYFRIQNVRIAYLFDNKELMGMKLPKTTVSFTAERPLTLFDYNGFNPEVADGVDRQTYPIPAIYTFGLNIEL